jgi:demethylmenaquinone methyltransferase/2-methoxy-6-polyprenyl-1,4-benzoquinol methylase
MADQTPEPDAHQTSTRPASPSRTEVWKMFDRIAGRYDLLNHLLSANIDKRWRRQVASLLPVGDQLTVLDLAAGTGDQLLALNETGRIKSGIGTDLSEKMLAIGRDKIRQQQLDGHLSLHTGDAQEIIFDDAMFDAVTISFGIRNMTDVNRALSQMYRVLKPGGRALILEFSLPESKLLRTGYLFYLRHILPKLGSIISGDNAAYRYLNETIETFPCGDNFCQLMRDNRFTEVSYKPLSFGIASIYQGDKK